MANKISLRIFWGAMLSCAGMGLTSIWVERLQEIEVVEKIIVTLLITGIASFLIWVPTMAYRFLYKSRNT